MSEGSYPHIRGGVGTWSDMLIRGLPGVDFSLVSLVANPNVEVVYDLPDNVTELVTVPLWGTSEVLELQRHLDIEEILRRKLSVTEAEIREAFEPLFRRFVELIWELDAPAEEMAIVLRQMARYFRTHDYDVTMRSRPIWEAFVEICVAGFRQVEQQAGLETTVSLDDLTNGMRLLYRWLTVLTVKLPDADVYHATAAGLTGILGILATADPTKAFILSEHGIYLRERLLALSGTETSRFDRVFQAQFVQRITEASYWVTDRITPCNDYNHRWELRNGALPEVIQTVHNGVDASRFSPPAEPRDPNKPPTAIWLGRIDPLKDLETLIHAAAVVKAEMPEARFILYGKPSEGNQGYYEDLLALRAELEVEEQIIFGGFTSSPEAAYHEGDFSVLSSISEGFPYSVVEAMMCARTVVGTNVGGVSEALNDVGIVVEPRNPQQLGEACLELFGNLALAQELGRLAREKALAHFTLEKCNATFYAIYCEVAAYRIDTAAGYEEPIPLPTCLLPAAAGET
ncbi:MAG: GT4 family glycosyltransferase PelF [Anaerolineae bacterium]